MKGKVGLIFFLMVVTAANAVFYDFDHNDPIDVVIPAIAKDQKLLDLCIAGIKRNGVNVRRVVVVSPERLTKKAEWFDEKDYPFTKEEISFYLHGQNKEKSDHFLQGKNNVGWYYQQLLKLYAPKVIPNLSSNVLVLDADTIFFRPVSFINEKGGGLYSVGDEYHEQYFDHAKRLLEGVHKVFPNFSGICHHMLFQKPILDDLMAEVESKQGLEFWKAFCLSVGECPLRENCFSEYEVYFNYAFSKTDQVQVRPLKWTNRSPRIALEQEKLKKLEKEGFDYASFHHYLGGK